MIDNCVDQSNVEVIKVNFGRVGSGRIVKKTVKLTNESCVRIFEIFIIYFYSI